MKMMININHLLSLVFFFIATCCDKISSLATVEKDFDGFDLLDERWSSQPQFRSWQNINNKKYSSKNELLLREKIWYNNQVKVVHHNDAYNAGYTSWKMTMQSPFADLTAAEFTALYLMDQQHCSATDGTSKQMNQKESLGDGKEITSFTASKISAKDKDVSIDWRTKGIMTPIKNQGNCGSCWTFSTSGCLEAHTCLALNVDCTNWKGLAEQQLIDCSRGFNNFGCSGGLPSQAYEYIKYSGGMDLETSYSYEAKEGSCLAENSIVGATVAEVYNITSGDEDDLVNAISQVGPVSIAYQVSADFRFYQHGVYDSYNATTNSTMCKNKNTDVNHAVVAIGLGTAASRKDSNNDDSGIPYYIVRNSWGKNWGMEGHFWMKRGENLCGVSDCASFPIVPTVHDNDEDKKSSLMIGQSLYLRKKKKSL
mmetsp:Transcript_6486/g.7499  ORF Transcript_6486/g.7499 Transcript_6486/m.7499 type:complete len:425 (-) Transcript_6486:239-1513(-)